MLITQFILIEQVVFIEDECYWNAVSFGTGKEAVDECGGSFGIVCCDNQERLVDISSNDMALLREVR